jgi:hypothetical protein
MVNAHVKETNEGRVCFVYPGAWDFISMQTEIIALVEQVEYFVFGRLATRNDFSGILYSVTG